MTAPAPISLDLELPVFDNEGYEHFVVSITELHVVTRDGPAVTLWCRRTGRCLVAGHEHLRLSNARPAHQDLVGDDARTQQVLATWQTDALLHRLRRG
jgi:hypothetical protein